MSEAYYPNKITEENIQELKEKAARIKKKAFLLMLLTTGLYGIFGIIFLRYMFPFIGSSLLNAYPDLSPTTFWVTFLVVFVIIFLIYLYFLLNLIEFVLKKAFKFPRHEERIFAQIVLMVYYLKKNERTKAIREVNDFITHLSVFTKDFFNYPKGKMYAPEFNMLINGRNQIERMLFFSEVEPTSTILTNFGLSLVSNEEREAYSSLKRLIEEVQKYGRLEGRLSAILTQMKKYDVIVTWILLLIPIILVILGIPPYK
jgi:hypothetical protein